MYIQIYQLHGLIRSENLDLGRDEDTGGQVIYVIEIAKALANMPQISRVEIVTRLFKDSDYPGYSQPFEQMSDKVGIVRVPCGPSRYLKKVELWDHLDEFYENIYYYIDSDEHKPDILHSNYADSGYICNKLSLRFNIPHVWTAHSLGKPKFDELKSSQKDTEELNKIYNFSRRIHTEEDIIKNSQALIISCNQERYEQFSSYNIPVEDKKFRIINPGVNTTRFRPFWDRKINKDEKQVAVRNNLVKKINHNLSKPEKPCVFMLSRLEPKKNISNMVECYADSPELQEKANLIICAGKITERQTLSLPQRQMIEHIEKLIRLYNMEGKVYLFDEVNYETEIPELYRIVGRKGGIFVDCDITDPLPLTVVEAAMSGIPVVANNTCALLSVISKGKSELLINVKKHNLLSLAILKLLNNRELWDHCAKSGVECILHELTWELTAQRLSELYQDIIANYKK